jgi:hypothetical protein
MVAVCLAGNDGLQRAGGMLIIAPAVRPATSTVTWHPNGGGGVGLTNRATRQSTVAAVKTRDTPPSTELPQAASEWMKKLNLEGDINII